ncbi:MAG: AAA family ATPase [Prevotella sp.]|nr:AAA family ATPase [Prevotella sp.]
MIKSLTIKNSATFNDDGITINNLEPINIIYGSNGSGKSTIGKVISNLDFYEHSSISWNNDIPLDILVYNKDFCKKNFQEQIPGIFTLGESGTTAITEISKRKEELNNIIHIGQGYKNDIDNKNNEQNVENRSFIESAWNDVFKKYEKYFSRSAIGAGTKEKFRDNLMKAFHQDHSKPLSFENLKSKADVLFATAPSRMELYELVDNSKIASIEYDSIWAKVIVGKQDIDIAGLISKLGNSDWISKGIEYMEEESDVCPFCQQHTITSSFRSKLNEFFDKVYKHDINKIRTKCQEYKTVVDVLIQSIDAIMKSVKTQEKLKIYYANLDSIYSALKATISKNLELISSKGKEPSRIISLADTYDIINAFNDELNKANNTIKTHNNLVDNFSREKSILIDEIWKLFASEYNAVISGHIRAINGLEAAVKNLTKKREKARVKYLEVKNEITDLEKSITSVTPTVNKINRLLKSYGFTNFEIKEVAGKENLYQIVRENGEIANDTLSEGETTFITFLYYMQLVKGSFHSDGISSEKVLIIDDPVSSLDSNILYVVSTLIRDVFTDIHEGNGAVRQIILLTHNVFFHKETAFIDKNCKWRHNVKYLVLCKRDNVSSVQDYENHNPIKSSYELMWTELKNSNHNSCIVVQNIMRRILENYFKVLGGITMDVILEKFDNLEERTICRSLLSWVNDGSHSLSDALFVEMSDDQLERYKIVFKNIFIKMGQEAHYEMMMQMKDKEDESYIK